MSRSVNKQKPNIAFFGTSDRSIPVLEQINKDFNVVLCLTKEDTKIGRKQDLRETAVKHWAKKHDTEFLCISDIKNQTTEIVDLFEKLAANLGVVVDFSFIIPKKIIETPSFGLINVHFSLLPKYRGASPVQFAILNDDANTGITYQLVDYALDKGDILAQSVYKMVGNETAGEIYNNLFDIATGEISTIINNYTSGRIKPNKQDESLASYTYSPTHPDKTTIFKEDAKIDWNNSDKEIYNMIRAFNPWPIAWTTLGEFEKYYLKKPGLFVSDGSKQLKTHISKELKLKIYEAKIDHESANLKSTVLQVEGKNLIDWNSFVNGYVEPM